jgi:hypothetical protein
VFSLSLSFSFSLAPFLFLASSIFLNAYKSHFTAQFEDDVEMKTKKKKKRNEEKI